MTSPDGKPASSGGYVDDNELTGQSRQFLGKMLFERRNKLRRFNPAMPMIHACVEANKMKMDKARHEAMPKMGMNREYSLLSTFKRSAEMLAKV